jgi:Ser/Thr protein kinase RdoA (MazF antagonist)
LQRHAEAPLLAMQHAVHDALPVWSLSPATRVELLHLSENATFLLHDPDAGRRLILRVHRPGYHTEAEIRSELAWIVALREHAVVATPAPVAGADGKLIQLLQTTVMAGLDPATHDFSPPNRWLDARVKPGHDAVGYAPADRAISPCPNSIRYAVAFEYVLGREPARTDDLIGWFQTLGTITARMHLHARAWTLPRGFVRSAWDFPTMLGERPVWGDWRAGLGLDTPGTALLQRAAECLQTRLARFGQSPDRFGLIHADLRLANLIVTGDTLNVIDFDDCGFGWFAYDFAASVSFFEHEPRVPALLAAWLDGYRTLAPFSREAEAEMPVFIMLRRLLLLAWIASHRDASAARQLGSTYTGGTLALADDFLRRYG